MSDKKRIVCTLSIGMPPKDRPKACRESHQAAAKRWNAQYVEITEPIVDDSIHPWFNKLRLHTIFDYHRIIFLDEDTIVREDCPNLFDIVPEKLIGGVSCSEAYTRDCSFEDKGITYFAEISHIKLDNFRYTEREHYANDLSYYNTGLIVFDGELHAHIFDRAYQIAKNARFKVDFNPEQACLHLAMKEYEHNNDRIIHYPLPRKYNSFHFTGGSMEHKYLMSDFIGHVGRTRMGENTDNIVWTKDQYEKTT